MTTRRTFGVAVAAAIAVAGLAACGGGGSGGSEAGVGAIVDPKQKAEGLVAPSTTLLVDLKGLDEPTALEGDCFDEYVVVWLGQDGNRTNQYLLSFHVKSDPDTESELFAFLGAKKCSPQQGEVFTDVIEKLDLPPGDANTNPPLSISYRTSGGRRFFL